MKIIKRNGETTPYDERKIINAIESAMKSALEFKGNEHISKEIELTISKMLHYSDSTYTVEEISDLVETQLMRKKFFDSAKKFIVYRYERSEDRMIEDKRLFIKEYRKASNPSEGSRYDANANVESKNIATLAGELHKRENILINRKEMTEKMEQLYGKEFALEYIRQLNTHEIYKHDETSIMPYCVSVNMYPFLTEGLDQLGGHSEPPTHLQAFSGSFVNLVFAVASQFAGAVATPEYLMYMDHFIRKEYGDDYFMRKDKQVLFSSRGRTIEKVIEDAFQQVVYSLNQPAAARSYQSIFWNIGYFDKFYFESMFGDFYFPNGDKPQWESLDWLQRKFMDWFNKERTKKPLTFPVETMALLTEGDDVKDKDYAKLTAMMYSKGHSFFTYMSESADSLSSCCRLRNEIADNEFSFSLGAGGVATGSKSVITINMNRLVQNACRMGIPLPNAVREQVLKIHKYQIAFNEILRDNFEAGMLPVYNANFISMDKQFLTVGINGMVEAAEFIGIDIKADNPEYKKFIDEILKPIYEENKRAKTDELMFNTEFVPAENLGVKHANWDREDGYFVPRETYNSYFYIVEDEGTNVIDKFKLHGKDSIQYLDGGSALHCNLEEHLSYDQYRQLLRVAATTGCNYFTFNIPNTLCNSCKIIDKRMLKECPSCGSKDLDYLTRIIGYLKRVSSFSVARQREEGKRHYGNL